MKSQCPYKGIDLCKDVESLFDSYRTTNNVDIFEARAIANQIRKFRQLSDWDIWKSVISQLSAYKEGVLSDDVWLFINLISFDEFDLSAVDENILSRSVFEGSKYFKHRLHAGSAGLKNQLIQRSRSFLKKTRIAQSEMYDYVRDLTCLMSFGPQNYSPAGFNYLVDGDAVLCSLRKTGKYQWKKISQLREGKSLLSQMIIDPDEKDDGQSEENITRVKIAPGLLGSAHVLASALIALAENTIVNTPGQSLRLLPVFGGSQSIRFFNELSPFPIMVVAVDPYIKVIDEIKSRSPALFAGHDVFHGMMSMFGSHADLVPVQVLTTTIARAFATVSNLEAATRDAQKNLRDRLAAI